VEDQTILLLAFFVILGASLVQGATAFGFALVATPLLLLFMPATEAVAISLVLGSCVNLFLVRLELRQVNWREVKMLMPAAAAGALAGVLLLKTFDGPWLKTAIALAFLTLALIMVAGHTRSIGASEPLRQMVGAVSGLLTGATSMGGPPVVLYLTARGLAGKNLRATLAAFFFMGNLVALAVFTASGLLSMALAGQALLLAAAVVPGSLAGRALTSRLNHQSFRMMVLCTMAALAFVEIIINITTI